MAAGTMVERAAPQGSRGRFLRPLQPVALGFAREALAVRGACCMVALPQVWSAMVVVVAAAEWGGFGSTVSMARSLLAAS